MTTEELNALTAQAESGDVAAMNQLGQIYGGNEFKDFEKAFYWHKKAAELGNVNSMSNLGGWCYLQGNGTEKNIPLADEWLKKSVENGWVWTWAFNELANIFANDAQYKDLNKAYYWYSKSAEAGDRIGMSNLGGWCYLWGNGIERDVDKAIFWLAKAADECGDIWSMNKLTYIYGELEGYTNNEQAAKWFLALIQKDCDPNSGVYEKTGYNKDLYEKVKNAILNSASENDMSSLLGSSSGGSLLGGSISFTSSNAKSYINQAEAAVKRKIEYKAEETRRMLEEEERRIAEEVRLERERKEQEEKERREREERERQERERQERERREREERERKEREARELLENLRTKTKIDVDYGYGFKGREWVKNLKGDIVIPDGATRLGNNFFEWCKEITSMTIPNSVTSIGEGTFRDCANLKSIIIPDSVTEIGAYCFSDCKRLTTIVLPNGLTKLEDGIFNNCESLTEIIIPNGVTCICNFAFLGSGLTSIVIPDSVESIGEQAFSCDNLASVSLGEGITEIGGEAFGSPQVLDGDWRKGDWRNGKIKWIPSKLTKISIPLGTRERYEQMEGLQEWFDEDVIVEE